MNIFESTGHLERVYRGLVGCANYASFDMSPDVTRALAMAKLQPGDNVLDLGCAGGKALAPAKRAVKNGVVVGVDAVQAFLDVDAKAGLLQNGLFVAPAGSIDNQVHLIQGNATDDTLLHKIRVAVGCPLLRFHAIIFLHVFGNLPGHHREAVLLRLKAMLAPGGRILMDFPVLIQQGLGYPPDSPLMPVQLQPTNCTEIPGRALTVLMSAQQLMPLANGNITRVKTPWQAIQVSPNRLWIQANCQAIRVAVHVHMRVAAHADLAKGDDYGLPHVFHSPPQAVLDQLSMKQLHDLQVSQDTGGYRCFGRINETVARREYATWPEPKESLDVLIAKLAIDSVTTYEETARKTQDRLAHNKNYTINQVFVASVATLVRLESI